MSARWSGRHFPTSACIWTSSFPICPVSSSTMGRGRALPPPWSTTTSRTGHARAEGKRYSRTHLAYLTALCALKQVLSVKDAGLLLAAASEGRPPQKLYEQFREELDRALDVTAGSLDGSAEAEELPGLALALALRSYADRLACQRILELLRERAAPAGEEPKITGVPGMCEYWR